jgi:hypothetical protein
LSAKNIPRQVVVVDEHDDEDEVGVKEDDVDAGTTLLRIILLTGVNAFTPLVDDSRNELTIAIAAVSKRNFIIVNILFCFLPLLEIRVRVVFFL